MKNLLFIFVSYCFYVGLFLSQIRSFGFTPTTRSRFSLYPGVGQVFVVTVTHMGEPSRYAPSSAYIPSFTYGCDLSVESDCQTLSTTFFNFFFFCCFFTGHLIEPFLTSYSGSTYVKVLCALSLFIGLLIAFAGHRYFQIEMILAGFVAFSAVSYVILVNHFDANVTGIANIGQCN